MAKITEYPKVTSFDNNDVILKDGTGGTKTISVNDAVNSLGLAKIARVLNLYNDDNVEKILGTESAHVDLNSKTTPGVYRVEQAGDNGYIDNGPYSKSRTETDELPAGFRMIVTRVNAVGSERLSQIVIPNSAGKTTSPVAFRNLTTSGWSEWNYVYTTGRIPVAPSTAGEYVLKVTVTVSSGGTVSRQYSWVPAT